MLFQDRSKPVHVVLSENRTYELAFAALSELPTRLRSAGLRPGKCVVVTDSNVATHYRGVVDSILQKDGWDPLILTLPAGEKTKSPKPLNAIYDAALQINIDRSTPIIALGGGVIGDLAGYAASTLLRGLPFVQVPTSLLAQVDSSIGGKTGINHDVGKNLIGTFYQPKLVLVDTKLLYTLPRREWTSGLAEVVKHALISDEPFFAWLESEMSRVLARDPGVIEDVVYRAASIKSKVVSKDEKEQGIRAILNFGHTFGHALEKALGYGVFTHGEAVATGMRAALFMSRRFNRKLDHERADALIRQIPVPPVPTSIGIPDVIEAMVSDKKRKSDRLRYVLLRKIGDAYVTDDVTASDVQAAWSFALGRPTK